MSFKLQGKYKQPLTNLLGDSWNYMPPILIPSSAKRIATKILVIAKLNGKDFTFRGFVCDIMSQQGINCSKLETEAQEIRCERCSSSRMKDEV